MLTLLTALFLWLDWLKADVADARAGLSYMYSYQQLPI